MTFASITSDRVITESACLLQRHGSVLQCTYELEMVQRLQKRFLKAALLCLVVLVCTFSLLSVIKSRYSRSQDLVWFLYDKARIPRSGSSHIQQGVGRIPKILHHIYLDGFESLKQAESSPGAVPGQLFPTYNSSWRKSCHDVHRDWQFKFWDLKKAEDLLQELYPWFLPTFNSYSNNVQRGDSLRPFLMHAKGGLYLDVDVECFLPTDKLLSDSDIVLQLEDTNPKSLNNAVMASVPGHPFWLDVIQIMVDRGSRANAGFLGFKQLDTILKTTGPYTIRDAFKGFTHEVGPLQHAWAGRWVVNNTRFQVYPMGQWFEPCLWNDYRCHADIHDFKIAELPANLVGHHINAGVWLKDSQRHNRKLGGAWLLTSSIVCSSGILWWKVRRRAKAAQNVSSPHFT